MEIWAVLTFVSRPWIIIVWSLVTFVYAEMTLRLRENAVVYGQPFALVCYTTVDASTQYAVIYRSLSPDAFITAVATISYKGPGSCQATPSSFSNYTYSCENNGKDITLTVPADNLNEHNTYWKCINPGGTVLALNNMVSVYVNDPVHNVTVGNNTMVNVIEGISETFVCETSPCRPSSDIYWMKNGNNISNPQGSNSIRQSGTKNITTSSLQFTAVRGDSGSLLSCGAYNGYGTRKLSMNISIIVYYPPIVNLLTSPVKVIDGRPLEMVCTAEGNPFPQVSWNPAGEDNVNRSRLYYSAISRDNSVIHTCTATNIMVPTAGNQQLGSDSKGFLIDVLYPPSVNPFISPVKVIEGRPLEMVCSAEGNPFPKVTWNPAGEDMVNRSRLYYSTVSRDISVIHTCTATNIMVPTTGNQQLGSDSKGFLIDVLYSPIVNPFILPEVIEGQPLEIVCSADGKPTPQVTWNPAGEDRINKSRLYYSTVSRDMAIVHRCTATNNMVPTTGSQQTGSDFKELLIDVLYSASVSLFTSKDNISVLNEHSSLQLLCQVDSNPYSVISLYFEKDLKLKVENARNLSYTNTAVCLDTGRYTCSARNKIMNGDAVSRSMQINVTCYPRLDHRKNVSTEHYGALGDNVTLVVYVIAYPEPTDITWYHRQKESDMWQLLPYQSISSNGLYSNIMVHLASERDFGHYMVNMSNDFGIYNNIYHIIPESTPGVPTNFTVTVNGPDSVTLEWTPGSEGGHPQEFIIQYRIFPDGAWLKLDRIKDNGSNKQTLTITGLQQKTTYEFHLYAENIKGHSGNTGAIVTTPATTSNRQAVDVAGVAGGISAGLVVILVVGMGIFLWRRYKKQNESDKGAKIENEERLPESDSYDKLHPYANNDFQMYSSLKTPKTSKDSQKHYENTWIKARHNN